MRPVAVESPGDAAAIGDAREAERIRGWRLEELVRAGYDDDAAARIADRPDIDLQRARQLLARGCSPELALRILL